MRRASPGWRREAGGALVWAVQAWSTMTRRRVGGRKRSSCRREGAMASRTNAHSNRMALPLPVGKFAKEAFPDGLPRSCSRASRKSGWSMVRNCRSSRERAVRRSKVAESPSSGRSAKAWDCRGPRLKTKDRAERSETSRPRWSKSLSVNFVKRGSPSASSMAACSSADWEAGGAPSSSKRSWPVARLWTTSAFSAVERFRKSLNCFEVGLASARSSSSGRSSVESVVAPLRGSEKTSSASWSQRAWSSDLLSFP